MFGHHDEDDAAMRNTNPSRKYFLGVLQTVPRCDNFTIGARFYVCVVGVPVLSPHYLEEFGTISCSSMFVFECWPKSGFLDLSQFCLFQSSVLLFEQKIAMCVCIQALI